MRSAEELKMIFHEGWRNSARIENWIRQHDCAVEEGRAAWTRLLARVLGSSGRLSTLDVGTGPGFFAQIFARLGHESTGVDFSERMLAAARRRTSEAKLDCRFVQGDAECVPFENGRFDVVCSRLVIFTLPDPFRALRDWLRVLKPGGRLILMGEDEAQPSGNGSSESVNGARGFCASNRKAEDRRCAWKASPEYLSALKQLPMWKHRAHELRALMERAGAVRLQSVKTDDIVALRKRDMSLGDGSGSTASHPYVWLGFKAVWLAGV